VRGISLKLQEEERERRMEFVPDRSEADTGPPKAREAGKMMEILGRLLKTTHLISSHHFDDFLNRFPFFLTSFEDDIP